MNEKISIVISAEIDKLKKGVSDAKNAVDKFTDGADKGASKMDEAFKKVGDTMKGALVNGAKAATGALAAVGTALIGTAASTEEYRNEQAKLTTAFETAGASAEQAKTTYNDLYRVLGDSGQATEAANHLAKLTTEEESLSEWTNICQGVYATFGDSLPIESLTEAANETAKTGQLTGGLADALNWAGVSEDEFQEKLEKCNSEAEREKLIRETLSGIYDDAASKYEENAASSLAQNEAQAKLTDTLAQLGETMQPVITAFTEFANEALEKVVPHVKELGEKYGPTLKDVLSKVGETLGEVVGYIVDNWEKICGIAGVIGAITAAITLYNVVAAIKAAMAAAEVTTVWGLVAAYAAQAAATIAAIAPYLLIVAAIAAVIAIIVLCVKHWDEIKEAVAKAWDWIKEKTGQAVDAVVKWFTEMKDKATEKFNELKEKASEKFNELKTKVAEKAREIWTNVVEKFEQIKTSVGDKISQVKENIVNKFNEIRQAISDKISQVKENVVNKFNEIKEGISARINYAKDLVATVFTAIKSTIQNKVGEAKDRVLSVFDNIKSGIKDKIEWARDKIKAAIDKIKGFFNFNWSLPKIKLPHFSITGKFSLNPPSIPKFGVDWYAKGGIMTKPTAFGMNGNNIMAGGEAGHEAILPLSNLWSEMDKRFEEQNKVLANNQNSTTTVVVTLDGREVARNTVKNMKEMSSLGQLDTSWI